MSKEPKRNVYVGHRYVPKIMGEWDKTNSYEGLSIVTHQGNSYTSKKHVPVGIDITNEEYWAVTGNYNAQIEQYRKDVRDMQDNVNTKMDQTVDYVNSEVNDLKNYVNNKVENKANQSDLDETNRQLADNTNKIEILNKKTDSIVSVKELGAKGDGVTNDTQAFKDALAIGGKIYIPSGQYIIRNNGNNPFLEISKDNTALIGIGNVEIIFDNTTKGTYAPLAIKCEGKKNIVLSNLKLRGHLVSGTTPKNHRAWGVGFYGVENLLIEDCVFDTFEGHNLHINRNYSINNWIDNGVYNSATSVTNLLNTSSKNVTVTRCNFINPGSSCFAMFGVYKANIYNNTGDTTGGRYDYFIWTDDASQETPLENYSINTDIVISNNICRNGTILLTGCAKATVSDNIVLGIWERIYDFDQQRLNLPYDTPFLWANYLERGILIHNNICNYIRTRSGGYVYIEGNIVTSNQDNAELIVIGTNTIYWHTNQIFRDDHYDGNSGITRRRSLVIGNYLIAKHENVTGTTFHSFDPHLRTIVVNNFYIVEDNGSFLYTDRNPSSQRKTGFHYVMDDSSGFVLKTITDTVVELKNDFILSPRKAPTSPIEGTIYYDQSSKTLKYYDGTTWKTITSS